MRQEKPAAVFSVNVQHHRTRHRLSASFHNRIGVQGGKEEQGGEGYFPHGGNGGGDFHRLVYPGNIGADFH